MPSEYPATYAAGHLPAFDDIAKKRECALHSDRVRCGVIFPSHGLLRRLSVRITSRMNAGRSIGQREVMRSPSTTTSSST